jgi:glycolate oxidase iron-sulfur subunit
MTDRSPPDETACVKCGRCLAECPVYEVTGSEAFSPRGKLALIGALKAGGSSFSGYAGRALDQCLLCGRCGAVCTSQVATDRLVRAARTEGWLGGGKAWLKKVLARELLARPNRQRGLARAGRGWGSLLPEDSGLRLRMPAGPPPIPLPRRRPFVVDRDLIFPGPAGSPRAAVFVGCLYNHVWPRVAAAAIGLLRRRATVIVPAGQVCCGLAAASAGDQVAARRLADLNRNVMGRHHPDLILTLCASCQHQLTGGPVDPGAPVQDATAWLADQGLDLDRAEGSEDVMAAYHRPCHLPPDQAARVKGLLASTPGLSLAALPDRCCGHGGLFRLFDPKTSAAIRRDRLADVIEPKPDLVLTNCSGCAWQLWEGLMDAGIKVRHPLEALAERIGEGA